MANVTHSSLTGANLHEPKGVATANSGEVYVADGGGSGAWTAQTQPVFMSKHIAGLTYINAAGDPTNDVTVLAGTARDATNTEDITLSASITKRLDAAWAVGDTNGGLDTGAIANIVYYIWLIKRTDTDVVDVLFSASGTAPTMPTNYDKKRRIGAFIRTAGAIETFVTFECEGGGLIHWHSPATQNVSYSSSSTTRTLSRVPIGYSVEVEMYTSVGADVAWSPVGITANSSSFVQSVGISGSNVVRIPINTSGQVNNDAAGSGTAVVFILSWKDFRRD